MAWPPSPRPPSRRLVGAAAVALLLLSLVLVLVLPGDPPEQPRVFAHYFPTFPVSFDNLDPAVDYYAVEYLAPDGESGKHLAYGGWLRDRPLTRAPLAGDWRATDMRAEVNAAADAGIDGFFVDVLYLSGGYWDRVVALMNAAHDSGRGVVVVPQLDMNSRAGQATIAEVAAAVAQLAAMPAAYRLDSGAMVLSAFRAEVHPPSWWVELMDVLRTQYGVATVFAPTLLDAGANLSAFAPISWAVGEWGTHSPGAALARTDYAAKAHALGTRWVAPVNVQSERPYAYKYWEAGNLSQLRASWSRAIGDGADMVLMVTWNDYSEGSAFAPSVGHGYALLQANAYYAEAFRTGAEPAVTQDLLVVSHRSQAHDTIPLLEQGLMALGSASTDPARDNVEIQAFLTAPATLTLKVGTGTYTFSAPAGVSVHTAPLRPGRVSATATRGGTTIATVTSPYEITTTPPVQDLQYHATSSKPQP